MKTGVFQQYILCLPVFDFEQTDSYDFIKKFQKAHPKQCSIFDRYSFLITQKIMANASKIGKSKQRMLIFIDDAALSAQSIYNPEFYGMLSIARHLGISLMINYHSLTSGKALSPFVRQNTDALCLYKIVSEDLLHMIYDEYVSLASNIGGWKDFRARYIKHTNDGEFQSLLLNCRTGQLDWDLKKLASVIAGADRKKAAVAVSRQTPPVPCSKPLMQFSQCRPTRQTESAGLESAR